jgi:hypothetical protein
MSRKHAELCIGEGVMWTVGTCLCNSHNLRKQADDEGCYYYYYRFTVLLSSRSQFLQSLHLLSHKH